MKTRVAILVALLSAIVASSAMGQAETAGAIDLTKASRWFAEFDSVCTRDAGRMWGASFCGPMMFVDPGARKIVANRSDSGGTLRAQSGVFVGDLPPTMQVANTSIAWQGARWTMIIWWSLSDNQRPRLRLMAHEAFHRMQPQLKLESAGELNDHLDTAEGRFWMQLEWNALQVALAAPSAARRTAIDDALLFRAVRRAAVPGAREREASLEIEEGVAEYSGARLTGYSDADVLRLMVAKRADSSGFVRSFAYISGPLYGYLLDSASNDWRTQLKSTSDLGDMLAAAMHLAVPSASALQSPAAGADAERRAATYGGTALRASEQERDVRRTAQLAAWHAALVNGPVLILDLKLVTSGTFDPGKVYPIASGQTVYTVRALEAAWGVITVSDGAILEDRGTAEARVSLAGAAANHLAGAGWTLTLSPGWSVVPADRPGDFRIGKQLRD